MNIFPLLYYVLYTSLSCLVVYTHCWTRTSDHGRIISVLLPSELSELTDHCEDVLDMIMSL